MPYTDFQYLNPIHIIWRKGTSDDPYVLRTEFLKVVNQTVVLSEIPDKVYRVRINGYKEINYEKLTNNSLAKDEFYVNYSTGVIQLNSNAEASTVNIIYKGRGFIQYPSDRIYHQDKFNNVVLSLRDIIENSNNAVSNVEEKFRELEGILEKAEVAINNTNYVIDDAKEATEDTIVATELALEAYQTTKLVFKAYVNTFSEILTKYPSPQVGWTVQVYETGERYRYDGIEWIPIDAIGGNIPLASDLNDGLLEKSHYTKIQELSVNTDVKIMTFVIPQDILQGIQDPHLRFDLDGEILEASAFVSKKGTIDLPIDIEVSRDYENWNSILDFPVLIEGGSFIDNKLHNVTKSTVTSGDVFRLNVSTFISDAKNLTILVKIKID